MRVRLITLLSALILIAVTSAARAQEATFRLSSTDVTGGRFANAQIFNGFGCSGENVSPQLSWSGAPAGTKSFVLTIYDPDAPTGSGFWHWVVANIPATATSIPTGASGDASKMPAGSIETRVDFGFSHYGGPCPPAGDPAHRYVFTIHALGVDHLDVTADSPAALVGFMVHSNEIGKATFEARYGR